MQGSDYYEKMKKRKANLNIPSKDTFRRWIEKGGKRGLNEQITGAMFMGSKKKKLRKSMFPELDDMVANFVHRSEAFLSDYGLGLSWEVVQMQAKEFAKELNHCGIMSDQSLEGFKASRGWISNLRRRKDLSIMKLQGELNSMSDEAYENLIVGFRQELKDLMQEHNVREEHVFNGDQSALYFKKFPCTTICAKDRRPFIKGTKAMISKDRITKMVCTSSPGKKCPMAYVGKARNPRCFVNVTADLKRRYTRNKTAWFNRGVTEWWFREIFAPCFDEEWG